jgi:hypothetical protein
VQVARTLKMEPRNVRIKVGARFFREGSVIAGTARSFCDSIATELHLESDELPERISQLIRMAEASCYTMAALRNVVPVELCATVNGAPFETAK